MELTKTQIDRLGDRLREGDASEEDLRLLDTFRRSFATAHDEVVGVIRAEMGLEPTSRPAKSTTSIIDKLRRESIRLTQMQDIAGCRIVVADLLTQDRVVRHLTSKLQSTRVEDRRLRPSHGYRAVHVVATEAGWPVEIQVRTQLQHLWAQLSERLSDVWDPSIKYGGGEDEIRANLSEISTLLADNDQRVKELWATSKPLTLDSHFVETAIEIKMAAEALELDRLSIAEALMRTISLIKKRN